MHDPSKVQFPPSPREGLNLTSSSLTPVNGHVQCQFSRKTGKWSAPAFIEDPFLRVHGLAPVFNYGQEVYEGLKAFRSPTGSINIFRPSFHSARLNYSASLLSIPPVPEHLFLESVNLAVAQNAEFVPSHESHGMLYIRPILFGSSACIQLTPPDEYTFCVYVTPAAAYHGINPLDALILEEFDRAAPHGTGSGKVGGNYAPVMKWSDQARRDGFAITLHLDSATRSEVEEFSTAGFVGIKKEADGDGVAVIVPDSGNVVDSVTVRCILAVAARMGWVVERRVIKYEELASFSEVLACGTAVTVIPIKSITCKSRGNRFTYLEGSDGKPGPYAAKLATTLGDIQKGKVEDEFGWLVEVKKPAL
ncbi:aminotransferase [Aspergillus foveolatus]|uniref:aminotransferase n=1 Tax=Aspergillus foveolatus TaxID=210207 RepID=UPI003CCCD152